MKYKCNKCGTESSPGMFDTFCPECGSSDSKVIYSYGKTQSAVAQK